MVHQLVQTRLNTGHGALGHIVAAGAVIAGAWAISVLPLPVLLAAPLLAFAAGILLRWPWTVWLGLAVALPVTSGMRLGPATATEPILLLCVFLWLLDGARRRSLRVYASPVLLPVLLYAGVQLISLSGAPALGDGVGEVVKWLEFALVVGLLPVMVPRRHVMWLSAALVVAGIAQAVVGLVQFYFQIGPEWFVLFDRFMRASGSFRQPNPYAGYLGVVLPVAASLAIWSWTRVARRDVRFADLAWTVFYTAGTLIIALGLLASWSRGGWLSAAAVLIVVVAVRSRTGLALTLAGAVALATAALVGLFSTQGLPDALTARLQGIGDLLHPSEFLSQPVTDQNFALVERLAHWVAGVRMWESAPWLGVGAGNYASAYGSVNVATWTEPLGHAHNLYINILAETGLIGLASFGLMWVGFAVWAWRRRDDCVGRDCRGWCHAFTAAVLGSMSYLTLHSLVDVLFVQGIYLALALNLATLAAGCSGTSEEQSVEHHVRA